MSVATHPLKELPKALLEFQKEASNIAKDSSNPHFKSKYASLEATIDSTRENLAKHGLSFTQTCLNNGNSPPTLITTLMHVSGEWISSHMPLIFAKLDMQGFGSAWSYARRYSLQGILGLAATDDDANEAVGHQKPQHAPSAQGYKPPTPQRVSASLRDDRENLRVNNEIQKQRREANYPSAPPWPDDERP